MIKIICLDQKCFFYLSDSPRTRKIQTKNLEERVVLCSPSNQVNLSAKIKLVVPSTVHINMFVIRAIVKLIFFVTNV